MRQRSQNSKTSIQKSARLHYFHFSHLQFFHFHQHLFIAFSSSFLSFLYSSPLFCFSLLFFSLFQFSPCLPLYSWLTSFLHSLLSPSSSFSSVSFVSFSYFLSTLGGSVRGDLRPAVGGEWGPGRRFPGKVTRRGCGREESEGHQGDRHQAPAQTEAPQHHYLQVSEAAH